MNTKDEVNGLPLTGADIQTLAGFLLAAVLCVLWLVIAAIRAIYG